MMILVTRADATFVNLALLADSAITLHFIVRQQIYELFAITTNICEIFTIYSHNIALYLTNVVSFKDGSELDYLAEAVVNVVPVLGEVDGTEAEAVVAVFVVSFGEVDVGHGIDHDAVGLQEQQGAALVGGVVRNGDGNFICKSGQGGEGEDRDENDGNQLFHVRSPSILFIGSVRRHGGRGRRTFGGSRG